MKNKVMAFLVVITLCLGISSVKADRVVKKTDINVTIGPVIPTRALLGTSATNDGNFTVQKLDVTYGGSKYDGYCLDYSYHASRHDNFTCRADTNSRAKGLIYAYNNLMTGDLITDTLMMRFIAIRYQDGTKHPTVKSAHVLRWYQVYLGDEAVIRETTEDMRVTGPDEIMDKFKKAADLASIAYENTKGEEDTNDIELSYTKISISGKQVTYKVTSSAPIDKEKISFTCDGCNIKNNIQDTWTGTEGTLIIEDTDNDCSYTINAYYPSQTAITCTCSGEYCQDIEIFLASSSTSGAGSSPETMVPHPYSDSITEGSYYEGVCGPTGCGTIPADKVEVNNCCEDSTTSKVSEPILNDLFCRDDDLKVDYYKLKSGINEYLQTNTDLDSNYCQMYCTERTQVDIPGALTATNGKYFKLAQNSVSGTYAPHTQSTKRCRIRVEYDKWLTDYRRQVDASVNAYNEYQKNKAYEASYRKAASEEKEENKKTETVTVRCVKEASCSEYIPGTRVCKPGKTISGYTASSTFDLHYYEHNFTSHNYERIARNSSPSAENIRHVGNFSTNISKTYKILDHDSVQGAVNDFIGDHSDASCSVSSDMYNAAGNAENHGLYFDDVTADANNYKSAADGNNAAYTAALGQIETLQKTLTRCDKYFTDDSVSTTNSAEQMYNLPTSLSSFKYTQIYQDDYGNPKQTQVTVGFEGSCQYTRETDVSTTDTFAVSGSDDNYSDTYGAGFASMKVLGKNLYYYNTTSSSFFTNFLTDETYAADKMFWHDGRYTATCDWNRTDVDKYTVGTDGKVVTTNPSTDDSAYRLVPRGEVYNYKSSLVNYSEHEFVFSYSSSYDGKFETYWDLKGLGENSKFDKYFEDGAGTCANQNPGDTSLLTCSLSSFHGGSFYGCCCGDENDTTYSTVTCDPYDDKAVKYEFKIVDPAKMFPADTDGYADNWKTTLGNTAREAIEELGKNLSTYSPKTLSYSFVLTPSDMKQIKKYNSILNSYGGYTDSDLTCDCSEVQGDGNKDNGKSCTKCTSSFLDNLASGKILKDQTLTGGWNRSDKSIAEVRKSGNVIWAVNK